MLTAAEGVYRKGKVELRQVPDDVPDDTRVIVTFLGSSGVDLRARGLDTEAAAELRMRLSRFAEDWESPEMDIYDEYDAVRSRL